MPTFVEVRKSAIDRFNTGWSSATPVVLANERYDGADSFVRLSFFEDARFQDTLAPVGNRRYKSLCTMVAQVFVPLGDGEKAAWELADDALKIMEGEGESSGVEYFRARRRVVGASDAWYQINVEVMFDFQERR